MEKNNQIKRIKELISEDTLYGKLVDREILNEDGGTKRFIDDLLGLISNNPQIQKKGITIPKIEKDFITNISNAPNKIAKISDTKSFKNYLSGEIFDDLATQMKKKLEPLRGEEIGGIINPITNKPFTYDSIIDNVGKQIDTKVAELKKEGKYIDFAADEIDLLFDKVFPGISDAYKIAKKTSVLNNIFKKYIPKFKNNLKDYFYNLFNVKENMVNTWKVWTNNFDGKDRGLVGKYFKSMYELHGGKQTFWFLIGFQFAKFFIMSASCRKTTGKVELDFSNPSTGKVELDFSNPSNGDGVVEGERFTEQEEEKTAAGEIWDFLDDIGWLNILWYIIESPAHGTVQIMNKVSKQLGIPHIAYADITKWSCDDIEKIKQQIENSPEAKENRDIIEDGIEDFNDYVKQETSKLKEIVEGTKQTIQKEASDNGINLTTEEMKNFINQQNQNR